MPPPLATPLYSVYPRNASIYVDLRLPHDKSQRVTEVGTHDDLEAPCCGIDFGSKRSKVKFTRLECG